MKNTIPAHTSNGIIRLGERVTFANGSEFRQKLYAAFEAKVSALTIDLEDTVFMDSAGLGLLLVAQKECQLRGISLTVRKPRGEVMKLLELTRCNERLHIV